MSAESQHTASERIEVASDLHEKRKAISNVRRVANRHPSENTSAILGRLLLDPSEFAPVVDAVRSNGCGGGDQHPTHCDRTNHLWSTDVSDVIRASLLAEYLTEIREHCLNLRLMPLDAKGKQPTIAGECSLDSAQARDKLHSPEEAVEAVGNGHRGFCLYAGRSDHGTERITLVDHDDMGKFPLNTLPSTLTVRSGSGEGYHETYLNDGSVSNAVGKDDYEGSGEVRASNQYCVLAGSIHPSGGVYHVSHVDEVATLSSTDIPNGLRPSEGFGKSDGSEFVYDVSDESEYVNAEGLTLSEVRDIDWKLDTLLSDRYPDWVDTNNDSEIDAKIVSKLRYHHFGRSQIRSIWTEFRPRSKLSRTDYVSRTITKCATHDNRADYPDSESDSDVDTSVTEAIFDDSTDFDFLNGGEGVWDQQIAIPRQDTKMRKECIDSRGRPVSWSAAQESFEEYLQKQRDFAAADWCDLDHRFTRQKTMERHAEVCDVDRYFQDEFNELWTVMLTLRGNQINESDDGRCPLDHYDELLMSNSKVGKRLSDHIDNRYARLTVLSGHKQGYAHVHWFFWVDGKPDVEPFKRALHAHLNNSPIALEDEHPMDECISIEQANPESEYDRSGENPVSRLVHEVGNQLWWPDVDLLDAEPYQKRFGTILWAKHYGRLWRKDGRYSDVAESIKSEHLREADENEYDGEDIDFDPSDFADAEDPTIEVEAGAWPDEVDPL